MLFLWDHFMNCCLFVNCQLCAVELKCKIWALFVCLSYTLSNAIPSKRDLKKKQKTFCADSGGTFPDDDGSHQQVKNSLFVGESDNHGMPNPDNRIWGPGGYDLTGRTLPRGM